MTIPEADELASIPRELPEGAIEEITNWWENGNKRQGNYRIAGEIVWSRCWDESGQLEMETGRHGDQWHGPHREWYEGQLTFESFCYFGKEHGTARQYDYEGNLISTYTMHYGTGLDTWYQVEASPEGHHHLVEERQYLDGKKHGFERWYFHYKYDNTVSVEIHFKHDEKHGIHRQWNLQGGISRGFPQYFVDGVKVTKRKYLTACKRDTSLPPYRKEDDDYHRTPLSP